MQYIETVQMICNKETFLSIITDLRDQHRYINALNDVLFEHANSRIFPPDCSLSCLSLLHNIFQDEEDLISHFIFVLNFGQKSDDQTLVQVGETKMPLQSASDLYDALILNLQWRETHGVR